jgi:hypothetical protein
MKKTLSKTNKFLNSNAKKREMIVEAVYSSSKIEGSKITKKELRSHYTTYSSSR